MSRRNYWDALSTMATVEWCNGPPGLRSDDDDSCLAVYNTGLYIDKKWLLVFLFVKR